MNAQQGSSGRKAEEQLVLTALAELIDRFGAEQLQDPGRVRSLLSDQLGADAVRCRRELNLVVSAAEAKVPAALLDGMPASLDGLASRLATQTGLGLPAAYWAVLAWAAPLGYAGRVDRPAPPFMAAETATTPSPTPSPTPQTSPTSSQPFPRRAALLAGAALAGAAGFGIRSLLSSSGQPNAQQHDPQTRVPETPQSPAVESPTAQPPTVIAEQTVNAESPTPAPIPFTEAQGLPETTIVDWYGTNVPIWHIRAQEALFASGIPNDDWQPLADFWQIDNWAGKMMMGNSLRTQLPPGAESLRAADQATARTFADAVYQGYAADSSYQYDDAERLAPLWDTDVVGAKYLIGVRLVAGQAVE